jgi:hypothetical protein
MENRRADRRDTSEPTWARPAVLCCHRACSSGMGLSRSVIQQPSSRTSFLRRTGWQEFKGVLAGLRDQCPTAMPVVVRTSWMPDTILGQCIRRRHRFVVRLNDQMGEPQAVECLLHEWAHALAWNFSLDRLSKLPGLDPAVFDRACHDEAWGCAYSRVWRAYLEVGG